MVLKRIGLYILVLCLVLPVFAVTASADESLSDISRYDALDYITLYEGSNVFDFSGARNIVRDLPVDTYIYGIEMVLYYTGAAMNITVKTQSGDVYLSPIAIGSNLYRYYAQGITIVDGVLNLNFTNSGEYSYVNVVRCYIETDNAECYPEVCNFNVAWGGGDGGVGADSLSATMTSPNTFTSVTWDSAQLVAKEAFRIFVYLPNWKKYDYMDLHFYFEGDLIDGISAYFDQTMIPYEVSYINDVFDGDTVGFFSGQHILMRLDLRGLDRSSSFLPAISIDGSNHTPEEQTFGVLFCTGYVETSLSGFALYWHSFKSFMTDLFNPDDSGADAFKTESAEKVDQMEQVNSAMNDLKKPDVNGIDVSLDTVVDPAALTTLTSPLAVVFEIDLFRNILLISATLALVSYVLFGKK